MKYRPYIIYAVSLLILWTVTLKSNYLIGTDIHFEYYFLNLSQVNGWDYTIPVTYNGNLPVSLVAPFIANLLHIDGIWLLKIVFPMVFALTPVLLYLIYKEYFSEKISLLAVLFFISMPAFFMEISGNAKQMIGETLMVFALYLIIKKKKLWMIIGTCILVVLSHYTMAFLLLAMLCIAIVVLLIKKESVKTLIIASATIVICGFFYYSWVGEGILMHVLNNQLPINIPFLTVLAKDVSNTPGTVLPISIDNQLVKMAFGSDFLQVSILGKMFRLLQYTTQILIVIGAIGIVRHERVSLDKMSYFIALFIACGVILGLWVVIPSLSGVIDVPRLYHVVLIMLSPALVIGGQYLFKNLKIVLLFITVYFFFTSGAMFELAKAETMDIPYSVAFSNNRMDLGGTITKDDIVVRDYIKANDLTPIYADWYGLLLLKERFGVAYGDILQIPQYYIPDGSLVFLTSRNTYDWTITRWTGVGQREYRSCNDYKIYNMKIIYECGWARIWQK